MVLSEHFLTNLNLLLVLPTEWRQVSANGPAALYTGPQQADYLPSLTISLWFPQGGQPLHYEAMLQEQIKQLQTEQPAIQVSRFSVEGWPAAQADFSWQDNQSGQLAVMRQLLVQADPVVYSFLFSLNEAVRSTHQDWLDQFAANLHLLPNTVAPLWINQVAYSSRETVALVD